MNAPLIDDRPLTMTTRVPDAILVSKRYGLVIATYAVQPARAARPHLPDAAGRERIASSLAGAVLCLAALAAAWWVVFGALAF